MPSTITTATAIVAGSSIIQVTISTLGVKVVAAAVVYVDKTRTTRYHTTAVSPLPNPLQGNQLTSPRMGPITPPPPSPHPPSYSHITSRAPLPLGTDNNNNAMAVVARIEMSLPQMAVVALPRPSPMATGNSTKIPTILTTAMMTKIGTTTTPPPTNNRIIIIVVMVIIINSIIML